MDFGRVTAKAIRTMGFRPIVWVLLLAFTVQSFITQVHIHHASAGAIAQSVNVAGDAAGRSKAPDQDSKSDCPFCQAIVHAGAFFAPPQIFVPQIARVEIAPPFLVAIAIESFFPHPWYSRGPPRR
jgi:hypothetical protein